MAHYHQTRAAPHRWNRSKSWNGESWGLGKEKKMEKLEMGRSTFIEEFFMPHSQLAECIIRNRFLKGNRKLVIMKLIVSASFLFEGKICTKVLYYRGAFITFSSYKYVSIYVFRVKHEFFLYGFSSFWNCNKKLKRWLCPKMNYIRNPLSLLKSWRKSKIKKKWSHLYAYDVGILK